MENKNLSMEIVYPISGVSLSQKMNSKKIILMSVELEATSLLIFLLFPYFIF